jgi:hypothetical protein
MRSHYVVSIAQYALPGPDKTRCLPWVIDGPVRSEFEFNTLHSTIVSILAIFGADVMC